jgi:SAM-dependent methyltransferase
MSLYSSYARIYEAIGQGAFGETLMRRLLNFLPISEHVLDLACGTGAAAFVCLAADCAVTGVDQSEEMLAIARVKAQHLGYSIAFYQADMRQLQSLSLPHAHYDLAVCLYDSLNYLLEDDDLSRVCAGVAALLRPAGRFIFDLNTQHEMYDWAVFDQVVYDDEKYLVFNRLDYDEVTGQGSARIVWFAREGERWWRGEELHRERAWSNDEVVAALATNGLHLTQRLTPDLEPAPSDAPRVVYVAQKR